MSPSELPQKVADCTFVSHQAVPRPVTLLSLHTGGSAHRVAASHSVLQALLVFLHSFLNVVFLHSSNSVLQTSLQASTSGQHCGGDGGGNARRQG